MNAKFAVGQAVEMKDGRRWVPGVITAVTYAPWPGEPDMLYDVTEDGDSIPGMARENELRLPRS